MDKVRLAQSTLVFGVAAGLFLALPDFFNEVSGKEDPSLLLVNGRIEGTEVAVGTKLAGRVKKVFVDEGQEVKKGDLISELESKNARAAYKQTQANVRQARHNLITAKENVTAAKSQLEKAKIRLELTKQQTALGTKKAKSAVAQAKAGVTQAQALLSKSQTEYDHSRKLFEKDAASELEFTFATDALNAKKAALEIARQQHEQAKDMLALADVSKSEVNIAKHDLEIAQSSLKQAKTAVGIAEAKLESAESSAEITKIQLEETKIYAPCDGVVITRVHEPGEIVSAGATLVMLVDFDQLYLKGYLPNQQIGKVRLGTPARVYLDAFRDKHFEARVTNIGQQAEFTPEQVDTLRHRVKLVFGIEISVDNPDNIIKPGMPGDAVIKLDKDKSWKTPAELR